MFFNGTERVGGDSYRGLIESARFADAHGFSSVWLPERHFTEFGALYPNPATLQAALARETKRLRLMAGSAVLPLHHLLRLVEEWSVVDNLSGGRAGMSFASGWNPADFALAPEAYSERQDALFAGIAEARRLWRGERMRVKGGDGVEVDVRIYPTPVQRELPLWVTAAGNPRTFERAGEIGAHLLTHLLDQDPAELAEKIAVYRAARERGGFDPAGGRVTVMLHTFIGATAGEVEAKVRAPFTRYLRENLHLLKGLAASRGRAIDFGALSEQEREEFVSFVYERFASTRALLGTEAACAPLVRRLAAAGVSEIACLLDFGAETEDVLAMLPRLAGFREAATAGVKVNLAVKREGEVRGTGVGDPCAHAQSHGRQGNEGAGRAFECFYEIAWRPVSLLSRLLSPERVERWVIAADAGGVGEALAARLRALGQDVAMVRRREKVRGDGARAEGAAGAARVINLWALDAEAEIRETLALLRATGRGESAAAPSGGKFWTVTRGAQAVEGVGGEPMGAAQWGLLRVLPVEQPQRWGGLIDLDPARPAVEQIDALLLALTTGSREDQMAIREGQVRVARLVPVGGKGEGERGVGGRHGGRPSVSEVNGGRWAATEEANGAGMVRAARRQAPALQRDFAVRAEGAYLVTGGLGGVGLAIARWLVARGARDLVLVGRSAPDAARREEIAALEKAGARVSVVRADVGERADVERVVAGVTGRPIRGVFHAAGMWQDAALAELTTERLANVWRAKAAGAANLDAVLRGVELDAFVLCSAFSSVLPAPHQGNYAAANAFLDGLARQRRARGEAAVAVGFGPWSEVGFATTEYGRRAHARLEALGIARFSPEEGIAVIERAMASGAAQVSAMEVDWAKLFAADPAAKLSPLLAELVAAHGAVATSAMGTEAGRIARALAGQPAERQAAMLTDELRGVVAAVLRMKVREVSADMRWTELGVDSLVALEIKNRLQRETGVEVPLTKLLEGPTAAGLAEEMLASVKLAAMAMGAGVGMGESESEGEGEGGGAGMEEVVL
jgi:natural product biosynthesis luciferase-like monooxygenase protein